MDLKEQNGTSLLDCYTNGRFHSTKWLKQKQRSHNDEYIDVLDLQNNKSNDPPTQHERKKRQKRIILARRSEDGELEEAIPPNPKESMWYNLYIACPQVQNARFLKKFRHRFLLPYNS